jgi:SpoVK/Ycf46/Vps4 family AAA+-type ATPase
LVARALAAEAQVPFVYADIASVVKSHVGEGEQALAAVFRRCRRLERCVLFFDELQAVFAHRGDGVASERVRCVAVSFCLIFPSLSPSLALSVCV